MTTLFNQQVRELELNGMITFRDGNQLLLSTGQEIRGGYGSTYRPSTSADDVSERDDGFVFVPRSGSSSGDDETDLDDILGNGTSDDDEEFDIGGVFEGEPLFDGEVKIYNYEIKNSVGEDGFTLGSTESGEYTLEIQNKDFKLTPDRFDGAEVRMRIAFVQASGVKVWEDFGVWYVSDTDAPEKSGSITLHGYDAMTLYKIAENTLSGDYSVILGSSFTLQTLARYISTASGIALADDRFDGYNIVISDADWDGMKNPPRDENGELYADINDYEPDMTLRGLLSYIGIAVGGFAYIDRSGKIAFKSYGKGKTYNIQPSLYHTFTRKYGEAYTFNSVESRMSIAVNCEYERFAVDASKDATALNSVQLEYNPFTSQALMNTIKASLIGVTMYGGELTWGGNPCVTCGDYWNVTDLSGNTTKIMVMSEHFTFDGGLSYTASCVLPSITETGGGVYSTTSGSYDSTATAQAVKLTSISERVIDATSGRVDRLYSTSVNTDTLNARVVSGVSVSGDTLYGSTVIGEKIDGGIVSAKRVTAGAGAFSHTDTDSLTALDVTADTVNVKHIKAEAGSIDVKTVDTTRLRTDELQANTAVIEKLITPGSAVGDADGFEFNNINAQNAAMVKAVIGTLMIRAGDGGCYRLDVDDEGAVSAVLTLDDITDSSDDTTTVVEYRGNYEELSVNSFHAVKALLGELTAAAVNTQRMTAADFEATNFKTSSFDAVDLSAQNSLTLNGSYGENFYFTPNGLRVLYKAAINTYSAHSVKLTHDGMDVVGDGVPLTSLRRGQVTAERVRVAKPRDTGARIVMCTASDGGVMFVSETVSADGFAILGLNELGKMRLGEG